MAGELSCRLHKRMQSGFEMDAELTIPLETTPVTVLFGPSAAGKTTLLRLIAGLDRPDEGSIYFRGQVWFDSARRVDLPPQQRRAGFLFQDYALFPHLSVARNVGFAAPSGKGAEILRAFGLQDLADRSPRSLSGGQQQRVALARALAAAPALILLDEPLSALDAPSRLRMRRELRRMLVESGVPAIVVTHDRMEALAFGDCMAVIIDGHIRQCGPIQEVFRRPADARVAESVGVENVLAVRIVAREEGLLTLEAGGHHLLCVDQDTGGDSPLYACIRAEDVTISRETPLQSPASSARNRIAGRVESVQVEGPVARVELDCGFPLVALITTQSVAGLTIRPGDTVAAIVKATSVHLTAASRSG